MAATMASSTAGLRGRPRAAHPVSGAVAITVHAPEREPTARTRPRSDGGRCRRGVSAGRHLTVGAPRRTGARCSIASAAAARAGRKKRTTTTPMRVTIAPTTTPRWTASTKAELATSLQLGGDVAEAVGTQLLGHLGHRADGALGRVDDRLVGSGSGEEAADLVAVGRGEHRPEHGHAERTADLPGGVVDRRSDAGLEQRQRTHDRVGGRSHGETHAGGDDHEAPHDRCRRGCRSGGRSSTRGRWSPAPARRRR